MNIIKYKDFSDDKNNKINDFIKSLNELTDNYDIVLKSTDIIYLMDYNGELGQIEYNYGKKEYKLKNN
jgi:hypothetical protein